MIQQWNKEVSVSLYIEDVIRQTNNEQDILNDCVTRYINHHDTGIRTHVAMILENIKSTVNLFVKLINSEPTRKEILSTYLLKRTVRVGYSFIHSFIHSWITFWKTHSHLALPLHYHIHHKPRVCQRLQRHPQIPQPLLSQMALSNHQPIYVPGELLPESRWLERR